MRTQMKMIPSATHNQVILNCSAPLKKPTIPLFRKGALIKKKTRLNRIRKMKLSKRTRENLISQIYHKKRKRKWCKTITSNSNKCKISDQKSQHIFKDSVPSCRRYIGPLKAKSSQTKTK